MRFHEINESDEFEHRVIFSKIFRLLIGKQFLPFSERMKIFGSMAAGKLKPGDIDIILDYSDMTDEDVMYGRIENIGLFLSLCKKFYGSVDVFIKTDRHLLVRNEYASGWVIAKHAKKIWNVAKIYGKPVDEVYANWENLIET